jgi:transposase
VFVRLKRTQKSKNSTVQVVESVRVGEKIKQRVIASLGVIKDESDREKLIQVGHALIAKLTAEREELNPQSQFNLKAIPHIEEDSNGKRKPRVVKGELPVYPSDLVHVRTEKCGFSEVFGKLSEQVGFSEVLKTADKQGEHTFDCSEIIQSLVAGRVQEPASKRRTLHLEAENKGHLPFELHHVYRALDVLLPYADTIQAAAHDAAVSLLGRKLECFFYDATTLFFESVSNDELKGFGFSKDCKFNQVQVLLCLIVTDEGIPVGYELFSGNTSEKVTLSTALESLAKRYPVEGSTIVGDRGILSQTNLNAANSHKMNYIVGEKLRSLPKQHHDIILDRSCYRQVGGSESGFLIREIPHPTRGEGAKLILGYSDERAKKDRFDREKLIKKIEKRFSKKKKANPSEFISNRGVKKYIKSVGGEVQFDREAIARDERWDGYFGIVTDHPTLDSLAVLGQYRGLWQIESQFRVFKHNLEARPIFHWTPDRIRSHILVCFMGLCLERHLELILKKSQVQMTTQNIHDALNQCTNVIFQDKKSKRIFKMGSNKSIEAKQIYTALGIDPRARTFELHDPGMSVVPTSHSVKPELAGIR